MARREIPSPQPSSMGIGRIASLISSFLVGAWLASQARWWSPLAVFLLAPPAMVVFGSVRSRMVLVRARVALAEQGKVGVLVYSESPNWQRYIEMEAVGWRNFILAMTRFKELARIQAAIESRDRTELDWAIEYCRSRIEIAQTSSQGRYWKGLLNQVAGSHRRHAHEPYSCGLKPGDEVRLRKDLVIRNPRGRPTGKIYPKGEVWSVLPGSCSVADDVWFRRPDGVSHTWDDDAASILEWFEKI